MTLVKLTQNAVDSPPWQITPRTWRNGLTRARRIAVLISTLTTMAETSEKSSCMATSCDCWLPRGGRIPASPRATPVEQSHNAGTELHQRRDLHAGQANHLLVPAAGALDEIEHLAQSPRHERA